MQAIRAMFEKEPFGPLERLMTQKLLDVAKRVTQQELTDENWLRRVARLTGRSYAQMRVMALDFLETDVFNVSPENCVTFLDPLIESWDIDLATFAMQIVLNRRLAPGHPRNSSSWSGNPSHRSRASQGSRRSCRIDRSAAMRPGRKSSSSAS